MYTITDILANFIRKRVSKEMFMTNFYQFQSNDSDVLTAANASYQKVWWQRLTLSNL